MGISSSTDLEAYEDAFEQLEDEEEHVLWENFYHAANLTGSRKFGGRYPEKFPVFISFNADARIQKR